MLKKKLFAMILVAPLMLTACQTTDSSSTPESVDSTVNETPVSSEDNTDSDTDTDSTPDSEPVEPAPVLKNFKRDGYVSLNLDASFDNPIASMFLAQVLPIINYSSPIDVYYTKADNQLQLTGSDANYNLNIYPSEAYYVPSDTESEEETALAEQKIIGNNYLTLNTAFNFFGNSGIGGILSYVGPAMDISIDLPKTSNAAALYRTGFEYYRSYLAQATDNSFSLANVDPSKIQANSNDVFSLSWLNGKDGRFVSSTSPKAAATADTETEEGTEDLSVATTGARGYEEFTVDSTSGTGLDISSLVTEILSNPTLSALITSISTGDIYELLADTLLGTLLPSIDFDAADYPVIGIVSDAISVLAHGLTVNVTEPTTDDNGDTYKTITLGLNSDGLTRLGTLVGEIATTLGVTADITDNLSFTKTEFNLEVGKDAEGEAYQLTGIGLDLGLDVSASVNFGTTIQAEGTMDLNFDIALDPEEKAAEDDYFTDLETTYAGYKTVRDEFDTVYNKVKDYYNFNPTDGISYTADETITAQLTQATEEYKKLSPEAKLMFGFSDPSAVDFTESNY